MMTNGWGECFCDDYECPECNIPASEYLKPPPEPKLEPYKFPDDIFDTVVQLLKFRCKEDFVISCYEFYKSKGFLTGKQVSIIRKICAKYITDGNRVYIKE